MPIIWFCRKKILNLRQKFEIMSEQSIESKILSKIKKRGRGAVLFAADFVNYGEKKSVNKTLERMTNEGTILRVARGVYYYPKIDKVLGLGVLYPTIEDIAEGIAKRDKARIAPTGAYALNRLGFSTQIPMNVVYLTDGFNRKIKLFNGAKIQFIRTTPKNFAFHSQLAMLLTFAYKDLGKDNITPDILNRTRELLVKDENQTVKQDYNLMPAWVSSIVKSLYEEE